MISGRCGRLSASAAVADRLRRAGRVGRSAGGSGRLRERPYRALRRLDVERQHQHHRSPLDPRAAHAPAAASATAVCGPCIRSGTAPTERDQLVLVDPEIRADGAAPRCRRPAAAAACGSWPLRSGRSWRWSGPALVDAAHADLAGDLRVGVGHRDRAALVARRDEPRAAGDQRVGDGEVAAADQPEDVRGPERRQACARPLRRPARSTLSAGRAPARAPGCPSRARSAAAPRSAPRRSAATCVRFASWVRPYLPAPSRNEWHGNGGSKLCAAPASVPTVSTPKPMIGASLASHRASSTDTPGVCGPVSLAFRNAAWSCGAGVPAGAEQQPTARRQRTVLLLPRLDVLDFEQEVRIGGAFGALVDDHRRADQLPAAGPARRPGRPGR